MMSWLAVGLGGALGAMLRHGLVSTFARLYPQAPLPMSIFLVNVAGSLAIGVIAGLGASSRMTLSHDARLFVVVGILGGFTTFSSFSLDTLTLVRGGHMSLAIANVVGQVAISLLAVAAGYRLAS